MPTRPNIVIIFADDMGYSDLGCYGSEIATPNIDRLAKDGIRMSQFYNSARCCPSRAALLTGLYNHQAGVGCMIDHYATWIRDAAHSEYYSDHLRPQSQTIPEILKTAGYQTIMCGKWHLGDRPEEWPVRRGFDRSFVLIPGAMNYYGSDTDGPPAPMAMNDQKFIPPKEGFYSTDAFATHAIQFVDEAASNKDKPFFLYLAFNAPHWPLQAPQADIDKYRGKYAGGWQAIREKRDQADGRAWVGRIRQTDVADGPRKREAVERAERQAEGRLVAADGGLRRADRADGHERRALDG